MCIAPSRGSAEGNTKMITIKDLHVEVEGKEILKGISLILKKGKVHALMGPNGSGKSTLANVIMGHPKYKITKGSILLDGEDITKLSPDERAKRGLFLSFQYPKEIEGVTIANFLKTALGDISLDDFEKLLKGKMKELGVDESFAERYLNTGFSGGEKKKAEILQLLVLNPSIAILDETDSGLDIDALRVVAEGINNFMNKDKTVLIITHYKRILEHINPDKIFILKDGRIVKEGSGELVERLEEEGYGWLDVIQ